MIFPLYVRFMVMVRQISLVGAAGALFLHCTSHHVLLHDSCSGSDSFIKGNLLD